MKNVLTIDIDFISKDLRKYNDEINTKLTPSQNWQVLRWITGIQQFEKCDNSISFILKVIGQKCKNATFLQVKEHEEVIPILERYKIKDSEMWNIDYHHDLGYTPLLEDLDCSNWVIHARQKQLIKNYHWVTQDDAEYPNRSPISYKFSSYKDLPFECIPEFDMVIIVTSEYYTPLQLHRYNKLFYDYGISKKEKVGKFIEIPNYKMPNVDLKKYKHYLSNEKADRVFFYEGFFIELTVVDGVPYLSYINFGSPKSILSLCGEFIELIVKQYGKVGFSWTLDGTTKFLEKISRKYKKIKQFTKDNINYMILTSN